MPIALVNNNSNIDVQASDPEVEIICDTLIRHVITAATWEHTSPNLQLHVYCIMMPHYLCIMIMFLTLPYNYNDQQEFLVNNPWNEWGCSHSLGVFNLVDACVQELVNMLLDHLFISLPSPSQAIYHLYICEP